jgi:hypothetical protein
LKPLRTLVGLTAVATAGVLTAGPAAAAPSVDTIAEGLAGPLGLDVSADGIYVAQNFGPGTIDRVRRNGSIENVASAPDASGFVVDGKRVVYVTTTFGDEGATSAALKLRKANGDVKHLASLLRLEKSKNPDGDQRYGVLGVSKSCRQKLPRPVKPYKGILDSHPYAVADAPGGGWYVADAAGNDILHVNRKGRVKVVSVLEPVVQRITKKVANSFDLPNCTVGGRAAFEPVPTDVEVAKNGSLVVSLLPGGPEDPAAGARGQVVRINPKTGAQKLVAKGFAGATNVAIGKGGKIYVAELFGGRISQVGKGGNVRGFKKLNQPSAVEYFKGKLYATYDTFPPDAGPPNGKVAIIDPTP